MVQIDIHGDPIETGLSLALGNFDGVHLGHRAVFDEARGFGELAVVSFDPHPRRFFEPDAERFELMNARSLDHALRDFGAKNVYQICFDEALSNCNPKDFLDEIYARFAPRAITTGPDFRFGAARRGDVVFLREWGAQKGIEIGVAQTVDQDGEKISSTRIREFLRDGLPREAARLLGRPHVMNGVVTKGDQRGRELGYPTANLYPKSVMLPKFGIYATRMRIHDGEFAGDYLGASSLGVRPSFGVNAPNFETFILDFDGDIYGSEISVELIDYIRGEEKFEDIGALVARMDEDVRVCREILMEENA